MARAVVRQREIAVRAALGAGPRRVIRQLLTESVLLSLMGSLLGLLLAIVGLRALLTFGPDTLPRLHEIGVDGRMLAFTFFVSFATGILFGLAPALRASRVDLNRSLKEGGRGSDGGSHNRVRNALVVVEVTLSLVLLIGAGLLIRSDQHIQNASPGFNAQNVMSFRLSLPNSKYKGPAVTNFYQQLAQRIEALPGVQLSAPVILCR